MSNQWDPLARPPKLGTPEFELWFREHVAAFQRSRPDLPQGAEAQLSFAQNRMVMNAYLDAYTAAKLAQMERTLSPTVFRPAEPAEERGTVESASVTEKIAPANGELHPIVRQPRTAPWSSQQGRQEGKIGFSDLRPNDEILVRLRSQADCATCRAKVLEHHGDYVLVVLWSSPSGRWNRSSTKVAPSRVAQYPDQRYQSLGAAVEDEEVVMASRRNAVG
jgi:hypothetical protein